MPIFRDISSFTTLTNDQIKEKVASGWKPYTQVSTTEKVDLYDFLSLVDLSAIYKAIEEVKTEIEKDIQPKLDNLQTQITSNDTDITNLNNNKKNKQTFSSSDTVTSISGGQTIEVTGTAKITCNVNAATFTELQDTAYLMALGKTEVEFTSNNGALFINYENTQLPTGGTKCYKLVRSTQGNQTNIYIDVDSYIPVGGAYEIVISANKGTSRDNPLSAGQDTATITAELVTGDIPSGLKPTLSITGDGFSLDPETGIVTVASRGTTAGALRSATVTASYKDLEPKSITLYQAENKVTGYSGDLQWNGPATYPTINGSTGGTSSPQFPGGQVVFTRDGVYSSGSTGEVTVPTQSVTQIYGEDSGDGSYFEVSSNGTVTAKVNDSFTQSRSIVVGYAATHGGSRIDHDYTVTLSPAQKSGITISLYVNAGQGTHTLTMDGNNPNRVEVGYHTYNQYNVDQDNTSGMHTFEQGMGPSEYHGTNPVSQDAGTIDYLNIGDILYDQSPAETPNAIYYFS